jgi:hypothetical protein
MAEIVRGDPAGQGLVTIAVVDVGGFGGLALTGSKGVEISPGVLPEVKTHLASGLTSGYLNHELAHNFDLYWRHLAYYGDWGHAWTSFFDPPYALFYSRTGSLDLSPENVLTQNIFKYLKGWNAAGESATWARCVRNGGGCEVDGITANDAWAGFVLRYAHLHGPSSLKRAFQFLSSYTASNNQVPPSAEEKNDLLVRALAEGAGVNISCEVDAWRWTMSSQLRSSLSTSFPSPNPFCKDDDGDSFTPARGDFDDHNPSVHPGAVEAVNNVDDDCNGYVDDILLTEGVDFGPSNPPTVRLPVRIKGRAATSGDWDYFNIEVSSAKRVDVKLSSAASFAGWLQRIDPWITIAYTGPGGIEYGHLSLTQAGRYLLGVIPQGDVTGDYELIITDRTQSSNPVNLSVTPGLTTGTVRITATTDPSLIGKEQPTSVRFWADGVGFFQTVPFAQNTSIDWLTPAVGGQVGLRAQLLAQDYPISRATDPVFIQAEARPLYSIGGRITQNGYALLGVTVTLSGSDTAITQTAADGSYSFAIGGGGTYTLTPSKANYSFTPPAQTLNNLSGNQVVNFSGRVNLGVPILVSEESSTRALALDSVLRLREPFKLTYQYPWSADRRTRIMLFATNFELALNETAAAVTAEAEDAAYRTYILPVEYVGKAPGFDWLNCIVLRLSDGFGDVGDVLVRIRYRGVSSNRVRIGIGHIGGGLPDDPGAIPTPGQPPQ